METTHTLNILQRSLNYIEAHLLADITIQELANLAGYSVWHYVRLFHAHVGMPPARYTLRRRLLHALHDAASGIPWIETALRYGFNTHAGFYKAFRKEFGCAPSQYYKLMPPQTLAPHDLQRARRIVMTNQLFRAILAHWDIDPNLTKGDVDIISGNFKADYVWTVGDAYMLKSSVDPLPLQHHARLACALAGKGIAVSKPIPTRDKETCLTYEGRYYSLTKRLPGTPLSPEMCYSGTATDHAATGSYYGEAIAKLHLALEQVEAEEGTQAYHESDLYRTCSDWSLAATRQIMSLRGMELPDAFFEAFDKEMNALSPALPRQLIHRDPNPSNILWDKGSVSGFADFDLAERNIRLFDPCYCATGILSEAFQQEHRFDVWPALLHGILAGYDSVSPLTAEEWQAVPFVVFGIQSIFIAWLNDKEHETLRLIADNNRAMLAWLVENQGKWIPHP